MGEGESGFDVGRYLRLRSAVDGVLKSVGSRDSLRDAYAAVRQQVRAAIPESLYDEFDGLFPERVPGPGTLLAVLADSGSSARTLLAQLSGWLDGFVQEARMHAEVAAYAEARVREERGVGFKAPGVTNP